MLPHSATMVRLDVRVTSVQIVARFPAHVIIPEPPGWQPGCQVSAGVSPGLYTQGILTSSVILGTRGTTEYTAVGENVIGFFGSTGEK